MTSYETEFAVTAGDQCVTGRYVVAGDRYYIAVGDVEAFADGQVRREVDNRHREVTLVAVETENRNILSDPAHAFDLLDGAYPRPSPPSATARRRSGSIPSPEGRRRSGSSP